MESALTAVAGAITPQLSSANVVSVVVAGLGIALPLFVLWFGIRYLIGRAKGAFRRGR